MNEAIMKTNLFDYTWLHINFFHYCFRILLPITCIHDWHFYFFYFYFLAFLLLTNVNCYYLVLVSIN